VAKLPGRSLARLHAWSRVFILLLFVAGLLAQSTAVQTHLHFVQTAQAQAPIPGDRGDQLWKSNANDPPADCPLCREAAMAGSYVVPPAVAVPPPPAPAPWTAVATMLAFDLAARAQDWLSRAPPR
jgi:hypothetical protein